MLGIQVFALTLDPRSLEQEMRVHMANLEEHKPGLQPSELNMQDQTPIVHHKKLNIPVVKPDMQVLEQHTQMREVYVQAF